MISNKTERRIIAVAIGIISGCISFSFYSDGVTGAKLIIVAGLVIALKTGEFFFAMDIFNYWNNQPRQTYKAVGSALLVAVFYCLSVAATSISWYMQPQKEVAKLDVQRDVIKTLQADVEQAKAALESCPPMTFKNCITPKTAVLTEKQNALSKAIADSGKLSDVIATAKTWDGIAAFFNTDRATLEFGRDLIGGMLFDLIGILFFAQSGGHETEKKQVQQLRIDSPQPDIIQTQPPVEYQPQVNEYQAIENQTTDLIYSNCKDGLLESISLTGDVLVCAPEKGSGKSSFAAWFARYCKNAGHRVIVVDVNFKRGVEKTMGWYLDDNIEVIGGNGNYNQVLDFFKGIEAECQKRHKLNHNNYQQITIVIDEMVSVIEKIDIEIVKTFLKTVLTNGRQLKINVMICTHAPTIEGTGLKGLTGLKAGLECELFPSVDDETNSRCILKVVTRLDLRTQKIVKKTTLYNHPGEIVANWIIENKQPVKQPDFKPVLDSIVNVSPKVLKKSLNDDIFS